MTRHIERMETINNRVENDSPEESHYHKLTQNINSYFNIEQLLESLTDPDDVSLNEKGFNTLRMRTMQHSRDTYIKYKEKFFHRILKLNDISDDKFKDFLITKKKLPWINFIEHKIKTFDKIKKYVLEFLGNVEYCSVDETGYYFVFSNTGGNNRKTISLFATRLMEAHHTFTTEQAEVILEYIQNMSDEIIEIIYMLDYYSFKHLLAFIESDDACRPISWADTQTPMEHLNSTPLRLTNSPIIAQTDMMCIVGL